MGIKFFKKSFTYPELQKKYFWRIFQKKGEECLHFLETAVN